MQIALSGGGTGGHIYPCLALAEFLQLEHPEIKIFYFGNPEKLEAKLLADPTLCDSKNTPYQNYIEFVPVDSEPLIKTFNPFKLFDWGLRLLKNTSKAKSLLEEKNIDAIFATGGYAAAPTLFAASLVAKKYIIHNLDSYIGFANKAFLKSATALTLGLPLSQKASQEKNSYHPNTHVIGNPVAQKFLNKLKSKTENKKVSILVTGGSQGAKSLNEAIIEFLDQAQKTELEVNIVHVTGQKLFEEYILELKKNKLEVEEKLSAKDFELEDETLAEAKLFKANKINYAVLAYSHKMPELCNWAKYSICRSGAMTIAEMSAAKVVSIFVPLTWAAHDHQRLNASVLVEAGAAFSLDQNKFLSIELAEEIFKIITELEEKPELYQGMKNKLEQFGKLDVCKQITSLLLK